LRIRAHLDTLPPTPLSPFLHFKKASRPMQFGKNIGFSLLGVWLIINGLIGLLALHFEGLGMLMAILALASGILILVGR
jgi:hypothetical protein